MGTSSPPRKNPFRAEGLVPGLSLRVEVYVGNEVQTYATRVEHIDEDRMTVLVPMHRLQPRPLPSGKVLHCEYFFRQRRWRFATETAGWTPDHNFQYLAMPAGVEDADRRSYFRLATTIKPISVYRMVIDRHLAAKDEEPTELNCTIVDLSEGGLCLSSRTPVPVGEWLGLHCDLPQSGELRARLRVVADDPPAPGNRNHRVHCVFADIGLSDRDKIARFLMRRQLEMRRRGQI
ncbi:MAG: flagellar brake protein [Hyphomicrobiales bacterium]